MKILATLAALVALTVGCVGKAVAQNTKGQPKCKTSFSECVSKSVKDGWSASEASRYCGSRSCAQ